MSPSASLYSELPRAGEACFRYQGLILWRDFPEIAQDVRRWLDDKRVGGSHRRKVFSAFVEMTYNVLHHAAPTVRGPLGGGAGRSVLATLALGLEGPEVWVATENLVEPDRAGALAERLTRLVGLLPVEARLLYRDRVAAGTGHPGPTAGNNAGLGLLTVARDAARPLEYSLVPGEAPGELTTFSLKVYV